MIVNIRIEIDDAGRDQLANIIDGKVSKRLAKRIEVTRICERHIAGLQESYRAGEASGEPDQAEPSARLSRLYEADPADVPLMAQPDIPSYVYGWNKVKRGIA